MSTQLSIRIPDDVWAAIERDSRDQGRSAAQVIVRGLRAVLSVPPVQGMPEDSPQAPTRQSTSRRPATELDGKPITKNQQLATLAGPRCPRHKDFLWADCRRPACKQDFSAWLERIDHAEWMDRQKGEKP